MIYSFRSEIFSCPACHVLYNRLPRKKNKHFGQEKKRKKKLWRLMRQQWRRYVLHTEAGNLRPWKPDVIRHVHNFVLKQNHMQSRGDESLSLFGQSVSWSVIQSIHPFDSPLVHPSVWHLVSDCLTGNVGHSVGNLEALIWGSLRLCENG